jgi:hypothetical protein
MMIDDIRKVGESREMQPANREQEQNPQTEASRRPPSSRRRKVGPEDEDRRLRKGERRPFGVMP